MLTPEQKKAKKEFKKNRKVKKWRRRARCRFLKNLLIWFVGFISSIGIVGGSLYLAVGVIPLNNFVGNDESIVKNEIANGSLLSLIQSIGTYTIGDVPVLNDAVLSLIEGIGLEDMITIDTDKISSIPFSSLSDGSFTNTLISAVSFDATFKGVSDKLGFSLGDFSKLEVFTTYQEVPLANKPTEADYTASDFDHNSFYYMVENGTPPVYAPAFKDNAYANGVNDSTTLYYPALNDVPIMSFFTQLSSALDRVKVKDLVNTLGGGTDTSIINKIIGDTTIGNIGTFDHNTILLNDILPESSNADLYKILKDATSKTDGTTITVGDLNGIVIDNVKLSTVVGEKNTSNEDLYKILEDATNEPWNEITLLEVKSVNIDSVKLCTVVGEKNTSNEDLYKILEDATNKPWNEITLLEVESVNIDDVKLETVLPNNADNASIWNILNEAITPSNVDGKIRIKDLGGSSFNINNVKLETVFSRTENADTWAILDEIVVKPASSPLDYKITVSDLGNIKVENLSLKTAIGEENASNKDLYAILRDLTGKENWEMTVNDVKSININDVKLETVLPNNTDNANIWNILTEAVAPSHEDGKIRIKDLGGTSFNINNVKLATVLEKPTTENGNKNQQLWDIITEAVGENPSIGELSSFDVNKVHLSCVIKDAHGNKVLEALLKDSNSTIGNIADQLNDLKLKEMYDINCFTTDTSKANDVSLQYYKTKITDANGTHDFYVRKDIYDSNPSDYSAYTFDTDEGTTNKTVYYISKTDSGVWLLLLYKAGDVDENGIDTDGYGNANTYTCKCLTLGSLTTVISDAADCFMNATIKMLVDTGILTESTPLQYQNIYMLSVKTVFDTVANPPIST